jgi:hypothetical protein
MISPDQLNDLITLAEIEYTNACVHPDRYNVALRKKFVNDLYSYPDYNEMLQDYILLVKQHTLMYPGDSKYLIQMQCYVSRLTQALK